MSKSKAELLSLLQSKKSLAISAGEPTFPKTLQPLVLTSEFDKVKEQLGKTSIPSNKEHKDRVVKAKPKPCWIYICELKDAPGMLLTQVRHTQFNFVEECIIWCQEHCTSYTIKDLKGNVVAKI